MAARRYDSGGRLKMDYTARLQGTFSTRQFEPGHHDEGRHIVGSPFVKQKFAQPLNNTADRVTPL